jgi:hypothetical protein
MYPFTFIFGGAMYPLTLHLNVQKEDYIDNIFFFRVKISHDLRQVGGFLQVSFSNKTDCHDIAAILLKVALNT